jgi:ligand-binding sensor domain-containing protein/signal transduction histidine kinase
MKKLSCNGYLILIFFLTTASATGQHNLEKVKFGRLQVSDGLSNSNVTCSLQDKSGFLWIGTEDGLNKYNGYTFKVYRNREGDSLSLLKNIINSIFEDSRGILWICTRGGGVQYYDPKFDRFIRIAEFSDNCDIKTFTEDHAKNLWIAGTRLRQAFAAKYDRLSRKWKHYNLFESDHSVESIIHHSKNEFWIGVSKTGFFKWNSKTNALQGYFPVKGKTNTIISRDLIKAVKDNYGNIWIATREGLSKYHVKTNLFTNYITQKPPGNSLPVNVIRDLCIDRHTVWLATENGGVSRLNSVTNTFTNFSHNRDDPTSLSDNSVWSVYLDRQGRIWIGTFSKGLCVIDPLKEKFSQVDIALENDIVNAIWKDTQDRLWIGTEGGLVMNDKNGVHYFKHASDHPGSLSNNPVLSIFEDDKQQLWFGTWDGGINRFNENKRNFTRFVPEPGNPKSLSNPNVYSLAQNAANNLLVSTYRGLSVLKNEKQGIFENHIDTEHEANNYLRKVFEDSKENLWLGSISELNLYDLTTKNRTRIYFNKTSTEQDAFINCLLEDKKGRIWVGTNTGLILVTDKKYATSYTTKDGLPNDIIRSMQEDNTGNLWIGTADGLCKFNPETKKTVTYDIEDGLSSNEFKPNASFKAKTGEFFFGGKGVILFYPDSITENPFLPPVFIDDIKLFNESVKINGDDDVLTAHIHKTSEISLRHMYNFFTLHYVALNFTAPDKNQYAYMLEGFHTDWNYVGDQRSATFTNLDPGTYTFRVKASNNDSRWNESGASLVIHILPPWWKTWWAKTAAGFFVIMIAIAFYRIRVRSVHEQNKQLERMVDDRTKALQQTNTALMNREAKIQAQNEELILQEEEIKSQNEELYNQREELTTTNETLTRQREELAVRNEELMQSEEEISAQRDLVSEQNQQLQTAREIIEKQNNDILRRNESLEAEVSERTKELVEYNQQLEQFAFISAHNLRAPVARILGLGQIIEYSRNNPAEEKLIIEKLVFTAKELDRVVKDLNTVLEIRNKNAAVITEINLEEELKSIRITLEKEIQETQTHIIPDFSQINVIHTIKPYLDSILTNLISNAIKYRHPDRFPVIHIKSEIIDNFICLTVQDNGLGLDLNIYKEKLFILYSRFHTHVEGKGMGLYLVKTQVASLGGKIEVASEPGNGITFKIYLKKN